MKWVIRTLQIFVHTTPLEVDSRRFFYEAFSNRREIFINQSRENDWRATKSNRDSMDGNNSP